MSDQAVVRTDKLTKKFGEFTALNQLTIELDQGHILGFIGPNGAGKTTTIKILVGLARPTSGRAWIAGADCEHEAKRIKKLVGYMPDTFGAYDNMRVREYLDFFGAAFGIPRKERKRRIEEVLDLTNSTYMRDLFVQALSHGMKQRIGLTRTLLHDPAVLILDEPANGLDPNARIEMREILLRLAGMGKTLIVTSHILPELSRICDTVAIITEGTLRAFGTLDEIMHRISQRRIMELQLTSGGDVNKVAKLLDGALEDGAEVTPSKAEDTVRFTTSRDDAFLAKLLAALLEKGVAVAQFREVPLDLEDAFLSVTRDPATSDHQEKAGGGRAVVRPVADAAGEGDGDDR